MRTQGWWPGALVLVLAIPLILFVPPAVPAEAASGVDFNPGNIISDAAFYDGRAMSATQVQDFLNQMVPECQSGYTCLKDYQQDTPAIAANAYCSALPSVSNESAASILARVGAACNISQKVLLVLLQKEQSLVTHVWPSSYRFDKATGFACPDTAACDPTYNGFFYQVYYAARQFQRYAAEPTRYNYQAGRVNNVLYNPNTACGYSSFYIVNQATAGLYNYTPYRPNAAALSNLYGTGDGCSSYGNRNFWRIYTDWFGSPTLGTSLLRTTTDATVYLVTDSMKYPIPSINTLVALAPLGDVGYVSAEYLSRFPTGQNMGRAIRDPGGTLYFYDRGTKLPFRSCGQVADYGYSCDSTSYVQLTEAQSVAFATGPILSSVLGTVTGERFYISGGAKAEILDEQSQMNAGLPSTINILTNEAIVNLGTAAPITRDGVFINKRGTPDYVLVDDGKTYTLSSRVATQIGASSRAAGSLSSESMTLLPVASGAFSGVVSDGTQQSFVLGLQGRWNVSAGGFVGLESPIPLTAALLDTYPLLGELKNGSFIKSPSNGSVYIIMPDNIRPISSWSALLALTSDGNPQIITVSNQLLSAFAQGPVALTAGTLYRTPENATVYFVDGVSSRVAFSSFLYPGEAGFNTFKFTSADRLNAYPLNPQLMTFGFTCDADKYVAADGALHYIPPEQYANFPLTYVEIDDFTCGQMKVGESAVNFIRLPTGSIYQLADGEKRKVPSMSRLAEINGGQGWMNVTPQFAALFPEGPEA